jgi:galactokinase
LSSSAALEVSTALALLSAAGRELPRLAIAKLCQQAEIEFTGTRCGIMDQFISLHGQRHCAILLDCRSLEYEAVALPPNVAIVVANTMVKHELAGSEYNTRRADCEAAAALLGVASLREASAPPPGVSAPSLRARHVLSENARVHAFIEALAQGDLRRLGNCMEESHASLRDDYEVSCPELDRMLELARGLPGYYGGRMTGGGFGGCTVNLVAAKEAVAFVIELRRRYHESTGVSAEIYITQAASGAHEVSGAEA